MSRNKSFAASTVTSFLDLIHFFTWYRHQKNYYTPDTRVSLFSAFSPRVAPPRWIEKDPINAPIKMPSDWRSPYRAQLRWLAGQPLVHLQAPETLKTNLLICRLIETHDSRFNDVNEQVRRQKGSSVEENVFLSKRKIEWSRNINHWRLALISVWYKKKVEE